MKLKRFIAEEKSIKRFSGPLIFSFAVFYLAFHALNGERGLYAYLKQSRNLDVSQQELEKLTSQRQELENRVKLMSNESLDLDLLDEESRRLLGTAKPSEVVLIVDPAS